MDSWDCRGKKLQGSDGSMCSDPIKDGCSSEFPNTKVFSNFGFSPKFKKKWMKIPTTLKIVRKIGFHHKGSSNDFFLNTNK